MPASSPSVRTTAIAVAMALLALGAGGCGNSSDESENERAQPAADTLPTPTKQQYIAATATICARADERIGAFTPLGTDPTTRASSLKFLRKTPWARAKVESLYAHSAAHPRKGAREAPAGDPAESPDVDA